MKHVKARMFAALIAVLAVSAVVIAPSIGAAEEVETFAEQGCEANNVCTYTKVEYEGVRQQYPCSWSGNYQPLENFKSARNRCGNKINYIANGGGSICMNPGGNRPSPGVMSTVILPVGWAPPYC